MTIPVSLNELRSVPTFADLGDDELQWILDHCEYKEFEKDEYFSRPGDPADFMPIILEGVIHVPPDGTETPSFILGPGTITGFLPFSRMTHFPLNSRAHSHMRALVMNKRHFPAMYQALPDLIPRLVGILTDRVRESMRVTTQTEKLAAIGKLSAGLAHELNNPAAAARQASNSAQHLFECYRETLDELAEICASKEIYSEVRALEDRASEAVKNPQPLDSLTRSDLEETMAEWLEGVGLEKPWHFAPAFVSAGFTVATLDAATAKWDRDVRQLALYRVAAGIEMEQVMAQMLSSTARISDLVCAMKDYSFMDRKAAAEVDVNKSLDATLKLFSFRFKSNTQLALNYGADLPPVSGQGGQLNQVWTNLIDNALDAMEMQTDRVEPGVLRITTSLERNCVLIQVEDNGPGIPEDVAGKIFDPFFTTKPQGEGTGLGLDTAYRIIRQHQGDIRFESRPGKTEFSIRLPIAKPA